MLCCRTTPEPEVCTQQTTLLETTLLRTPGYGGICWAPPGLTYTRCLLLGSSWLPVVLVAISGCGRFAEWIDAARHPHPCSTCQKNRLLNEPSLKGHLKSTSAQGLTQLGSIKSGVRVSCLAAVLPSAIVAKSMCILPGLFYQGNELLSPKVLDLDGCFGSEKPCHDQGDSPVWTAPLAVADSSFRLAG